MQYKLQELLANLDVTLKGDPKHLITGVNTIQDASSSQITFLTNTLYRKFLSETKAGAVILSAADAEGYQGNAIICANPYYVYACIAKYFAAATHATPGVHATAVVGEACTIHPSASIGAHCVIGNKVQIGANTSVAPHTVIGDDCTIGSQCMLDARVTLYAKVTLGDRVHIASGAVLGSSGFGFANNKGTWHVVPQLGGVVVGNDVDIGANTSIDCGAIADTIIEDGVKLDNLIQVGHNVKIGAHTIIAGCVAIAGSTTIGKYCMIGGASCLAGHITIADKVMITGMTAVTKSIAEAGVYSSGIVGAVPNHEFRKNNARFHRMEQLVQRVKTLEAKMKEKERE